MPDCCAAADCKQSNEQRNVSFFRFPLDPERCKQWVENCRRPDLQNKTPEYLHRSFKLCSRHFEVSLIHKESELRTVLKDGAIPTIFNFTTKKGNPQNSNRKRKTQATAADPVETKKAKDESQPMTVAQNVTEDSSENAVQQDPTPLRPEKEDPATSKAKEVLKIHFKETLAFTAFSVVNDVAASATKSMGGGAVGPLAVNPVCAEKVDPKDVLRLGEDVMREEIRNTLRMARFFSILLQDKVNIEGKDQIPIFIRSVSSDGFPQKHLLGFLPCDVDSDSLYLMLVSEIRNKWGLRMEHCRGFTYLTKGSLCQKLKEFSSRMLRDFPQVVLAPSDPYAFNMWLIRSLPVLSVQDVVNTVEEVATVLRQSEMLMKKLLTKITAAYSHIKGEVDRVKESCQNNWEYGTDAFQTMLDILEPLLNSIGEMCTSALSDVDATVVEQLLKLKEKLKNFNFIITLVILKNTLCCVSILNPSLRGIISISSTLQYTISNALKLLNKHLQEIPIFHRKWFSDAVGRAKKLGVQVTLPADTAANGDSDAKTPTSPEDYYRETLSKMVLQYLIDEVKRVLGIEMVRILRWLSLVPSYMADHNFSIRKDKVADANLNNLARPDSFYDELGCWEVKWRHASKRRILPTGVFATLKIPDIGFYPNVQSLLRVLGSIPCINADADVYVQYDMVLDRYHSYMKVTPAEKRLCNMAFIYVNQDVHFNIDDMVQSYVESHPDILQLLSKDDVMEVQPSATENSTNDASKEDMEEPREIILDMELERPKPAECSGTDKEALKSALKAALTAACNSQSRQFQGGPEEVEYVTKSEMNEVLKVCVDVVRDGILSEAGNSFFSLFIDRVVRFGETDFLPLFLRFVDSFDVMHLELMGFVEANLDTEAMCERLFDIVTKEWQLDFKYCRGQAYLGSGEISYKLKAFACKVQEKYPLAICTHCSCYSFNTWWSRSVPVPSTGRALDILEKIVVFFSSSPELEKQLDQVIAVGLRESFEKINEFQGNFCSSWQEKHDSYDVFSQILEPLVDCLERFQNSSPPMWSLAVINQAKKLLQLIRDFDFIVAIVALKNLSSFTRELSAALQKDHVSAASQLCQISGIVATLNRLKTNIKVFHQNWFDEACAFAQTLDVQVKMPESIPCPRDSLLKPGGYYKDAVSVPLVDHIINSVKDHFSDDHKEALNFLSLVPCSVTTSYTFESLKSKPPLYVGDLPDPDNFFTELSCWKVKWKTKVVSPTIPDTIFQTLRLPLMQYFANINTLLKIMSVLPSTTLEHCGEVKRHKMFQDYLMSTYAKDRTPCLAMLQVGTNFNRDLDRMVTQCLKVTPKTLEGICLDKEAKTLRNSEIRAEDNHNDEDMEVQQENATKKLPDFNELKAEDNLTTASNKIETQQDPEVAPAVVMEDQQTKPLDENGHSDQLAESLQRVFMVAARLARKKCLFLDLPKEDQDLVMQELGMCHWDQENMKHLSDVDILEGIVKSLRETILSEVQESPFFSIITDRVVSVDDKKYVPVFVRYVDSFTPKVELLGFLPLDSSSDTDTQAKTLSGILSDEWGLQMGCCRGQSFMCMGAGSQGLRKLSLGFLENFPLAVNTPSESCGLAYWLAVSLHNDPIAKVLGVVEDLLLFFDRSPRLHVELSQTREGLLNTPREALAEVPETCLSKWKKTEDFFDILVDMLEGILSCLDSVSNNADGSWGNNMSIHALMLSTAIKETDFVISLVILKNACAPMRNCSTIFRCGNPADIICELEKIPVIIESLVKMLENIAVVHGTWFEEATQLAAKVAGALSYPDMVGGYDSPEVGYRETVSIPVLSGLIEEMKFNFSECHLKALRVLSLLPTCNPLPILPEAPDKLYTIYQSDLPEPDVAEEEINAWAAVWREKYQDSSLPTSISETLHHPEAMGHPNVTTLLRLVAVLPSISMECDLMKTTLNSLRSFIGNDYSNTSKTNTVMLLMHRPMTRTLEQVIDKCMELDAKSHGFLFPVKERLRVMKMDSEIDGVPSEEKLNATSSGVSEIINGTVPTIAQDQPTTTAQSEVMSTSSALHGTTATPKDSAMEINTSNGLARMQESSPISTDGQSAATHPNDTETTSSTVSASDNAPGEQDVPKEHKETAQDVTAELQNGNVELLTEAAAERITTEPVTVSKDVPMELVELITKAPAEDVIAEQKEEPVSAEPVTAAEGATMEVAAVMQDAAAKPEVAAQGVTPEPKTSAQDVISESGTAAVDVSMEYTEPVTGVTAKKDIIEQSDNMETVTQVTPQIATTEPVTASRDVPKESMEVADDVTSEPVRGDKDIIVEREAAEQSITSLLEVTTESGITKPVADAEEVIKSIATEAANQGVAAKESSPEIDIIGTNPVAVPHEITKELVSIVQDATTKTHEAQGVPTEPGVGVQSATAAQGVTTEPGVGIQSATAAQGVTTEPGVGVQSETAVQGVPAELGVGVQSATAAQGVTAELGVGVQSATAAQGVTAEPSVGVQSATAAQGVTTEPGVGVQSATAAQGVTTEPGVGVQSATAAQGVTAELGVGVQSATSAQGVTTEPGVGVQSATAAQGVTTEPGVGVQSATAAQGVTTEPGVGVQSATAAQGVTTEPGVGVQSATAAQGVTTEPGVGVQSATAAQGVTTEPGVGVQSATAAQGVTTEPGVGVQSATAAQGVTTEPITSAQSMTMKPDAEDLPKELAPAVQQYGTSELSATAQNESPDCGTTSGDSTLEPQKTQDVPPSNKPTTSLDMTAKPVTLPQDTSTEHNAALGVTSVTASEAQILSTAEIQDVPTQSVTTGHDVTLDDQTVSKEPITASSDAPSLTATVQCGELVTAEQEVTAKSEPAGDDVSMDTTEAGQVFALQPTGTATDTVPTESPVEHVPMDLDGGNMTTESVETVQDVVMESQDESKVVVRDVTMEPVTEIQGVQEDTTEEFEAETQDTGQKADVQGVSDQVMAPAENGTCEPKILASDGVSKAANANEVDAVQTLTATKNATSDTNNSPAPEVKHQDDLDQSYAVAQDGMDPSKAVAQAAGEDGIEPHKGVLSFYSAPTQEAFFGEIQNAKFFSIICEQQIEIEGHTYIPVGICYLERRKTPCEDVLAYIPLDQDIAVFVDCMIAALSEKWGLNLAFCRGQSLLTVGAAGTQVRAAASLLSQRYPHAVRTFSSSMSLNTWLAKSCIISEIADSFTWVERMLQWVTEDEVKRAVLHRMVASLFQHDAAKHSDLTDRLSRSQWERSHDTLDLTVEVLEAIMLSLNDIKENHDIQTEKTQAGDFLIILQNFEFILTLVIMKNVLGPTKRLSQSLQGQPLDVYQAVTSLSDVLSSLSDMKINIDAHLQSWYQEAVAFASKLQIGVDHTSQECLIIYCRDIISKGAIDHSICEITELFSDHALLAVRCLQVVPYVLFKTEGCSKDSDPFKVYQDDLPVSSSLHAELLKWREKWLDADAAHHPLPAGLLDTLNATDAESFPNIETLLRLLMVLPCFRKEDLIRQGKKSFVEFNQQRSLLELYPL